MILLSWWFLGWVLFVIALCYLVHLNHSHLKVTHQIYDDEHQCCDGVGGCTCTGKNEVPNGTVLLWDSEAEIPENWRRFPAYDYGGMFAAMKYKEEGRE